MGGLTLPYPKEYRSNLLEKFSNSTLSLAQFSKQENICYTTFYSWVYRKSLLTANTNKLASSSIEEKVRFIDEYNNSSLSLAQFCLHKMIYKDYFDKLLNEIDKDSKLKMCDNNQLLDITEQLKNLKSKEEYKSINQNAYCLNISLQINGYLFNVNKDGLKSIMEVLKND